MVPAIFNGLKSSWQRFSCFLVICGVAAYLTLGLYSCAQQPTDTLGGRPTRTAAKGVAEVSPPAVIQELRPLIDRYQPQVAIVSPQPDAVLQDPTVAVKLQVQDLPLFQDPELKMGPHLHLILDNQPYQAIYDVSQPIVLEDLAPGTHTLRVFAARPWHESFKNEGAYAQLTFHIFTRTPENNPDPSQPILTYSRPKGEYGAEPILLDFYLTNAPLHLAAQADPEDTVVDWRIRCTINGSSFILDRWQPIYLKGWKPGNNWVQLEYLDEQGNLLQNVFNSTVRLIRYSPGGQDTLSKLVRGELSAEQAQGIVDPTYEPPAPPPIEEPSPSPTVDTRLPEELPEASPEIAPLPEPEPSPTVAPSPEPEKPSGLLNRFRPRSEQPSAAPVPVTPLPEILPPEKLESTGEMPDIPTIPKAPVPEPPEVREPLKEPASPPPEAQSPQSSQPSRFLSRFRDGRLTQPEQPSEQPLPIPETLEAPEPEVTVPTTIVPTPQPRSEKAAPGTEEIEPQPLELEDLPAEEPLPPSQTQPLSPVELNPSPQPPSQRLNWRRYLSPQPSPPAVPIVQPSPQPELPNRYRATPDQKSETELSPTAAEVEPSSSP